MTVQLQSLSRGRICCLVTVDSHILCPCCLHLSWISGKTRVPENVRNAANSLQNSTRDTVASMLSVHDSFPRLIPRNENWKQLRRESLGRRHEGSKCLRSTSITTTPAESNTKQSTFSELAQRLRNFHESASALADCLRAGDIASQTDPNMIEAAKHLYHKLLRKASDDLERMPSQPCASSPAEVARDERRYLRHGTSKGKSCLRLEALSTRPGRETLFPPRDDKRSVSFSF